MPRSNTQGLKNGDTIYNLQMGNQVEKRVVLEFIPNLVGYTFELVVLEASNVANQTAVPKDIRPGGAATVCAVRLGAANEVFLRFPKSLGSDWAVKPTPGVPMYGYFELRVIEPYSEFQQDWTPLSGTIALSFSATDLVG